MWPLRYFESDSWGIPEIGNPPSLSACLILFCALALYALIHGFLWKKTGALRDSRALAAAVGIPAILLIVSLFASFLPFAVAPCGVVFALATSRTLRLVLREKEAPRRKRLAALGAGSFLLLVFGIASVLASFPYYLPASYPPAQAVHLRMLRRLIEIQPHAGRMDRSPAPLSQAHLTFEGQERIPESLRQTGRYEGYIYTFHPDSPQKGLFTIDAVPAVYRKGSMSYHVFPVNPEEMESEKPNILYCISLADTGGLPATEHDRHFHRKELWGLIAGLFR